MAFNAVWRCLDFISGEMGRQGLIPVLDSTGAEKLVRMLLYCSRGGGNGRGRTR